MLTPGCGSTLTPHALGPAIRYSLEKPDGVQINEILVRPIVKVHPAVTPLDGAVAQPGYQRRASISARVAGLTRRSG